MQYESTYRLILLSEPDMVGRTAATPKLAKLAPGQLADRRHVRLGLEMTDWVEEYGKPKMKRTILIDAEDTPNEWKLGVLV